MQGKSNQNLEVDHSHEQKSGTRKKKVTSKYEQKLFILAHRHELKSSELTLNPSTSQTIWFSFLAESNEKLLNILNKIIAN